MIKTKRRKKSSRYHGRAMGTSGTGARKKSKGTGHRGGKGMSGSGKRADHKKTKVTKLYGHGYFGKQGITSKGTKRDKRNRMNVGDIQNKHEPGEVNLSEYKILGTGELKYKFIIKAKEASKSAIKKVEAAGGKIILPEISKQIQASSSKEESEQKKEEVKKVK